MGTRDARIDAYIAKSADFAKPILSHLRELVHKHVPDVEETIKWGAPHFERDGMLCGMASFKEHCAFGFWKGSLIIDTKTEKHLEAMGSFGRITSVKDLPSQRVLAGYLREAVRLNREGVKKAPPKRPPKPAPGMPPELAAALRKNAKARRTFDGFPPSHRREYLEWIGEAKREETRQRRIEQAIAWLAEGKSRNWKYERGKR